jgi:choline dehydrogenase-like flavoprotein
VLRAEQAPNPSSRVTLSEEKDALGLPRLNLDWQFSDIDRESAAGAMRALDHELKRLKFGYVEPAAWLEDKNTSWEIDPLISKHPIGGYHHMGTARMAESDKDGVVDADGRVHGVENLFIAGSAVFPTVGWANPTLTILALCLRLADKLKTCGLNETPQLSSK